MAKFQSQIFVLVVLTLFHYFDQFVLNLSFLVAQMIKNLPAMQKDLSLIPGLGRSPGEGNDYPLQYSGLENSMDREAWQATVHGVIKSPI